MLKDAGYKVPEINMEAYMKVRSLIQEFMDDFLGLYISPKNRLMNSLLIGPGLPGGMMGSLMSSLDLQSFQTRTTVIFILSYFIVAKRIILNLYLFTNTANKLKNIESKIIHIIAAKT